MGYLVEGQEKAEQPIERHPGKEVQEGPKQDHRAWSEAGVECSTASQSLRHSQRGNIREIPLCSIGPPHQRPIDRELPSIFHLEDAVVRFVASLSARIVLKLSEKKSILEDIEQLRATHPRELPSILELRQTTVVVPFPPLQVVFRA